MQIHRITLTPMRVAGSKLASREQVSGMPRIPSRNAAGALYENVGCAGSCLRTRVLELQRTKELTCAPSPHPFPHRMGRGCQRGRVVRGERERDAPPPPPPPLCPEGGGGGCWGGGGGVQRQAHRVSAGQDV